MTKIITLGPQGNFSHAAATSAFPGDDVQFVCHIEEVFSGVEERRADVGIIPVENTVSGFVDETVDCLLMSPLCVTGEIKLPVHHQLSGYVPLERANRLFVQPHTYKQCREKIDRLCPHCEVIYTESNGESAQRLLDEGKEDALAIISPLTATLFALPIIEEALTTTPSTTRFLIIEKPDTPREPPICHFFILKPRKEEEVTEEDIQSLFRKNLIKLDRICSFVSDKEGEEMTWIECQAGGDGCQVIYRILTTLGCVKQLGGV